MRSEGRVYDIGMERDKLQRRLVDLHPASYGWAMSCCDRNRDEAEDVLQTAYLKVLTGVARFDGRAAFKTWLFAVIRRTALDLRRRARIQARHLALLFARRLNARPEDPVTALERSDACRVLVAGLRVLPRRQREMMHLVFYHDLTIAEAAEVLEISIGTARTHYERGKAMLRRHFSGEGAG